MRGRAIIGPAATRREWDGARTCLAELFHWMRANTGAVPGAPDLEAGDDIVRLPERYRRPNAMFVATIDGYVVATMGMRLHEGLSAEIRRIWTRPAARGRGLEGALLEAVTAEAERQGARQLWIDTIPGIASSWDLYRRFGFRPVRALEKPGFSRLGTMRMARPLRRRQTA
jgi:ribosomal protein S18 acetylase RimI-like enzyme